MTWFDQRVCYELKFISPRKMQVELLLSLQTDKNVKRICPPHTQMLSSHWWHTKCNVIQGRGVMESLLNISV